MTLTTPTIKVGPQLLKFLSFCFRAFISVLLEGPTGIGKTEIVRELARNLGLPCIVLNLSILEPVDLTGLPYIKDGKTLYAPPKLLPTQKCVLFLDEINRVGPPMLNPMLQLLTLGELNGYKLPEGTIILAACNPEGDGYLTEQIDFALQCRFTRVRVEADAQTWAVWAKGNNVHQLVIEFILNTPGIFDGNYSNPRAWTRISNFLIANEKDKDACEFLATFVQANVGAELARAFMAVFRNPGRVLPPKADDVIHNYSKVRSRVMALTKAGDTSQLNSLCAQVLAKLQDPDLESKARKSARFTANLRTFRADLPAEYRLKLVQRHPWLKKGGE